MGQEKTGNSDLQRLSIADFKVSQKSDIYIVLDNLRSGNNIGSIFRTSDAFLIKKIFITGNSAIPPNREILKTALGACDTVEWEYHENGLAAIQKLKENGIPVFAIEQVANSISLEKFEYQTEQPIAIVFGNEVDGVDQEIINQCDGCIEIPQFGTKHSLNVAVSAGMVIWHLSHQLLKEGKLI